MLSTLAGKIRELEQEDKMALKAAQENNFSFDYDEEKKVWVINDVAKETPSEAWGEIMRLEKQRTVEHARTRAL